MTFRALWPALLAVCVLAGCSTAPPAAPIASAPTSAPPHVSKSFLSMAMPDISGQVCISNRLGVHCVTQGANVPSFRWVTNLFAAKFAEPGNALFSNALFQIRTNLGAWSAPHVFPYPTNANGLAYGYWKVPADTLVQVRWGYQVPP